MSFWVYILASKPFGTLHVGVTNDVVRRAYEHREGLFAGFTKQYDVKMLVYYEEHATAAEAIQREKNIKHCSTCLENRACAQDESRMARSV